MLAEVAGEVSGARVLLVADGALARPGAAVRQQVLAQVARRRVAPAARRASVRRLVPAVHVHVSLHRARLREALVADAALVPALARVHLRVHTVPYDHNIGPPGRRATRSMTWSTKCIAYRSKTLLIILHTHTHTPV